jgi:hypothetical protein
VEPHVLGVAFAAHTVLEMHSWKGLLRQCLSFTTTERTPSVSACSSLYQSLTVAPLKLVRHTEVGSNARNTSLSLNATFVRGLNGKGPGVALLNG